MSNKRPETVSRWSRILACAEIEFATEFKALCSARIVVDLHNVTCVQVSEECAPLVVLLTEVLAVYRDSVCGASPDADLEIFQACPIFALLGELVYSFLRLAVW